MIKAIASFICLTHLLGWVQCSAVTQNKLDKQFSIKLHSAKTTKLGTYYQPETCYFGKIEIGSEKQEFDVLFDMSFDDMIIPNAEDYVPLPYLHHHQGFKTKADGSHTCNTANISISYRGGKFGNIACFDNVTLKTIDAGQRLFKYKFIVAENGYSTIDLSDLRVDGFIGLSPKEMCMGGLYPTFIKSMQINGIIENATFSIYLDGKDNDGEITFGGVNTKHLSEYMSWYPSISSDVWALTMKPVYLGGDVVSCADRFCRAVFSSSVNDFYGPPADVYRIYSLLGVNERNGIPYLIDQTKITTAPNITFVIGKKLYSITPDCYMSKSYESYYLNIFPIKHGDFKSEWILGTNFMSSYVTAYDLDKRQIGIAQVYKPPIEQAPLASYTQPTVIYSTSYGKYSGSKNQAILDDGM